MRYPGILSALRREIPSSRGMRRARHRRQPGRCPWRRTSPELPPFPCSRPRKNCRPASEMSHRPWPFCCARAPTNVSRPPAIASATYSTHLHRSAFLPTALRMDEVTPYLLATGRDKSLREDALTRVAYRSPSVLILQAFLLTAFEQVVLEAPAPV